MDTSKAKKNAPKNQEAEVKCLELHSFSVENVRVVAGKNGDVVFFTLNLNDVSIYNCRVATGKNGDFISWPQIKGKDKYYNTCYARLSDETSKQILYAVQEAIDNM